MMELTQSLGKSRKNPSILGSTELGCKDQSWGAVLPRATDTLAPDQLCWQRLLMAAQCLLLEEGSTSWTEGHHLSEWPKFGISSSCPLLLESMVYNLGLMIYLPHAFAFGDEAM